MTRPPLHIAAIIALAFTVGCTSAADDPRPDHDTGPDAGAADTSDAGSDTQLDAPREDADVTDDTDDAPRADTDNPPGGACEQLSGGDCLIRGDCAWNGASCQGLDDTVSLLELLTGQIPGAVSTRSLQGFADDEHVARLTVIDSDGALRGALTIESDDGEVMALTVTADIDRRRGDVTLDIFASECLGDGTDCDNVVHAFRTRGSFDGTQILFPAAELADPDLTRLGIGEVVANLRFQPNDGVKPVSVPERSERFRGPTISPRSSPLPDNGTCTLAFTAKDLAVAEPAAIRCEDGTNIGTDGDVRILADTYAHVEDDPEDRLWFKIATPEAEFTVLLRDERDALGGVLIADDGRSWEGGRAPIDTADVAGADIVSTFILFAQEGRQ